MTHSTPILVTSPRITHDSTTLMQAVKETGQSTLRLQNFRPTQALEGQRIAVYGEPLFAVILSAKLDHAVIEPTADWLPNLPEVYIKRRIRHTTIGEARQAKTPQFVKNSDGMKAFEAQVYQTGSDLPSEEFYPEDYGVLVSEPVTWQSEYRCFIQERTLLTLSVYMRDGELAKSSGGAWLHDAEEMTQAKAFCQTILDDLTMPLPPACVVDVGYIQNRGWAVIETNPAYGSGIYGCDPSAVLAVVNRATMPQSAITEGDRNWINDYEVED